MLPRLSAVNGRALLAGGPLGAAVTAGLASYAITTYFLQERAKRRMKLEEQAAKLADAYRRARQDAAEYIGGPLSRTQQAELAKAFQDAVDKNGLRSLFYRS